MASKKRRYWTLEMQEARAEIREAKRAIRRKDGKKVQSGKVKP
jgi:hypothetical protein